MNIQRNINEVFLVEDNFYECIYGKCKGCDLYIKATKQYPFGKCMIPNLSSSLFGNCGNFNFTREDNKKVCFQKIN